MNHRLASTSSIPGNFGNTVNSTHTILSTTRWRYDAWNPVAEYSGNVGVPPTLSKTYLWGLDLSGTLQGAGGVGGLLSVSSPITNNPITYNSHHPSYDGNGNITAWTQSGTTTPVSRREYDAFGNIVVEQGTPPCAFGFSTKLEDPETGLLYYGHRYYCPPLGRWLSKDPIEERGGLNLYGFVVNSGVDWVDILGMTPPAEVTDPGNETWKARTKIRNSCTGSEKITDQVKLFFYSVGVNETAHLESAQRMNRSLFGGTGKRVGSMAELLDSIEATIGCCKCVQELHILSHGSQFEGVYIQSKTAKTSDNVGGGIDAERLGEILKDAMCPGARILLYGCATVDGRSDLDKSNKLPGSPNSFGKELGDHSEASVTGTPYGSRFSIDSDGHWNLRLADSLWVFTPGADPSSVPLPRDDKPW